MLKKVPEPEAKGTEKAKKNKMADVSGVELLVVV